MLTSALVMAMRAQEKAIYAIRAPYTPISECENCLTASWQNQPNAFAGYLLDSTNGDQLEKSILLFGRCFSG